MAGYSLVMLGWTWTDLSILGSQLFGQASAESCDGACQTKLSFNNGGGGGCF